MMESANRNIATLSKEENSLSIVTICITFIPVTTDFGVNAPIMGPLGKLLTQRHNNLSWCIWYLDFCQTSHGAICFDVTSYI